MSKKYLLLKHLKHNMPKSGHKIFTLFSKHVSSAVSLPYLSKWQHYFSIVLERRVTIFFRPQIQFFRNSTSSTFKIVQKIRVLPPPMLMLPSFSWLITVASYLFSLFLYLAFVQLVYFQHSNQNDAVFCESHNITVYLIASSGLFIWLWIKAKII